LSSEFPHGGLTIEYAGRHGMRVQPMGWRVILAYAQSLVNLPCESDRRTMQTGMVLLWLRMAHS